KHFWRRHGTNVLLGRPCRQGEASLGPMLDPDGCLARSAMRTQPSTEETGAIRTRQLEATNERRWQLALPKKIRCLLTTGRLMGVTVIPIVWYAAPSGDPVHPCRSERGIRRQGNRSIHRTIDQAMNG